MNHTCNGDHFTADGERLYRCLADSSIVTGAVQGQPCPSCARSVAGIEEGEATITVERIATLRSGIRVLLSVDPA